MWLALTDLFQARWTEAIHDEWTRSVLSDRPDIPPASLRRCRELMDEHVPEFLSRRGEFGGREVADSPARKFPPTPVPDDGANAADTVGKIGPRGVDPGFAARTPSAGG